MAKRFTDTDKWKKPFIKSLPLEYKMFWLYLLDDCDHAGIWHVDFEVAEIRLGIKLSTTKARGLFNGKVVEFDNGTKWFLPDFISFQYGELSEKNKMYKPVFSILNKYSLMGHLSPINGGKDKDKEKVMVKETDKVVSETEVFYSIEHCLTIAMNDDRWVNANKASENELKNFNSFLEKAGVYEKNPADYKTHFSRWKPKQGGFSKPVKSESLDPANQW